MCWPHFFAMAESSVCDNLFSFSNPSVGAASAQHSALSLWLHLRPLTQCLPSRRPVCNDASRHIFSADPRARHSDLLGCCTFSWSFPPPIPVSSARVCAFSSLLSFLPSSLAIASSHRSSRSSTPDNQTALGLPWPLMTACDPQSAIVTVFNVTG